MAMAETAPADDTNPSTNSSTGPDPVTHAHMANAIRVLAMDAVAKANSGHSGMPMGMADAATVLFSKFMKFDPSAPTWRDRDRFVLSAGHGSMLLYALTYLTGYEDMTLEEIKNFRQLGARTAGHPEVEPECGIETTTGPLGQGICNAVGMALAERILNARFGSEIVSHYTYVIASDGDLMEGVSHEACALAGHLGLGKLIVLFDNNSITIDGKLSLCASDDVLKRYQSYGWHTEAVDGHDPDSLTKAISAAQDIKDKPSLIACKTRIGYGAPTLEGTNTAHGAITSEDEIAGTRKNLDWPYAPFEIPQTILKAWRDIGAEGAEPRKAWQLRVDALEGDARKLYDQMMSAGVSSVLPEIIQAFKQKIVSGKPDMATRKASGEVLEVLLPALPKLIGGSADLTGSNNTQAKSANKPIVKGDFSGRYIYYGIREHGMASIMNGMALHGGIIPYGGTFLTFSDYARPAIRLSALMKKRVIYIMTHDSIGLGEDGPTHQPVEHLAALRAIPDLLVMRPCDAVETAECWQIAIENKKRPSVLALTRQNLPTVREDANEENLCARGAYILKDASAAPKVTLIATGSEVEIALDAQQQLESEGIPTRVVSMPCFELFEEQDNDYKKAVLDKDSLKVGIEAAVRQGWDRYIGQKGLFIGMNGFGASAPYEDLYQHFGITAEAVVKAVKVKL